MHTFKIKRKQLKLKIKQSFLIAILTMMLFMTTFQFASAEVTEWNTYCHVSLSPSTIGVTQRSLVYYRLLNLNPLSSGPVGGEHWTGFMVEITKPSGTTENKGPFTADPTGGSWFEYTPVEEGEYTFQAVFPGQWVNTTNYERWYKPSTSSLVTLKVQQSPIEPYPDVPLPTDYWRRPIYGENKGWWQIADSWLMRGYDIMFRTFQAGTAFAPYTSAPNSPHIMWSKPITFGGIGGGKEVDKVFYTGLSYETMYENIIIAGRIIYQDHGPTSSGDVFGTRCLDLYTGEEIWYLEGVDILFGQILDYDSPNEHGLLTYLWERKGSTWIMYDAFSGNKILTIENVTSTFEFNFNQKAPTIFGPNGEILAYSFSGSGENLRLIMWNSTLAILGPGPVYSFSPRVGGVIDGKRGIQWNVSLPELSRTPSILCIGEDTILAQIRDTSVSPNILTHVAYPATLEKDAFGNYPTSIANLWVKNRDDIYRGYDAVPRNIHDGVYVFFDEAELQFHGYSIETGNELWVSDPITTGGWGAFTYLIHQAYGKVFAAGFDGHVRAYDVETGELSWDYYFGDAGYETPYGTWPTRGGMTIADGKVYISNDEHSPDPTMWRGGRLWCFDAEEGDLLWSLSGWLRLPTISDGYLTALNAYDNQIYTIGKGPTKSTVDAPNVGVPEGSSILIRGTVTDVSPGVKQSGVVERFPNGLPAVSDEYMKEWMEYVYMQKPIPTNAIGVDVSLDVIDANGNFRNIGTTTSDISGVYSYAWKPDIPGQYTLIATFAGSESYRSSFAQTAFIVEEAPQPTPPPEPTPAPPTETYIAGSTIAILAGIAIAVFLILRKK